ncbi:hypothetical protein BDQ12DRAFT_321459 [Crucibulum laeve]|uniref:F-box domain-containing protein n=1 Tax=Crucibulum laeve TaxID=68775 RepID=A0A5C3M2U7_9AGAR|nr:hypothetical protein BDQ12DRAFT_321459 [Crucibulum laeve]
MPELWSNIVFEHNDISVDFFRLDRAETIAKTYIEQSSPHLITVKASLANLFHTPILDVMTSSSDRWKIAEFYGYEKDSIQKLLGVKSRVPHLQELTLRRIACTEECDAFENAPSLKRLILRDLLYDSVDSSGFQWNISMLKLPWSQIMYLTLETAMPFTSFESILRWTSSLVSLDVQDLILDVETTREKLSTDIVDSITLPAATTLFIHGRYAAPILQPLNLPNLESLYIHFGRNVHPSIPDQSLGYIADLIKRSSCIVRTLTISGTPDPMQVMGIIRAIPSLDKVRLNFEPESIQGSIFEMLHSIDNVHLTW